jgi:haloalkane dehalogenase
MTTALDSDFRPSPELYPFSSRWFDSALGRIHYVDEGHGRPILLVHGNPTWSFLYRKMIPPLCDGGLRCIAVDLPGHGLSPHPETYGYTAAEHANVVLSLVKHLDLKDLLVLGQDWGGPIGLWAAAQEPERVGGLVLGYTMAWPTTHWFVWAVGKMLSTKWGQRKIAQQGFAEWVIRSQLRSSLSAEELRHYAAPYPTPEHRRGLQVLPRELLSARAWLEELELAVRTRLAEKPALLLWGGRKEWFVGSPTRRFQAMFPDHTVVPLGRAGHFFQEDAPREVASAIVGRFGGHQGLAREADGSTLVDARPW